MSDRSSSRRSVLKAAGGLAGVSTVAGAGLTVAETANSQQSEPAVEWFREYEDDEERYDISPIGQSVTRTDDGSYTVTTNGQPISETGPSDHRQFALVDTDARGELQDVSFLDDGREETRQRVFDSLRTADGGLLLVGRSSSDGIAIKLDGNREKEWTTVVEAEKDNPNDEETDGVAVIHTVVHDHEDGYVVGGESGGYEWLARLAPDGTVEWERHYLHSENNGRIESLATTPDGGYVYAVWTALVKVDGDAEEVWNRSRDELGGIQLQDVGTAVNGTYIVAGRIPEAPEDDSNDAYDWGLTKVAPDGSVRWTEQYDGPYSGDDEASTVTPLDDGGVAIGGTMEKAYDGELRLAVLVADSDGTEQWRLLFGPGVGENTETSRSRRVDEIVELEDGTLTVLGAVLNDRKNSRSPNPVLANVAPPGEGTSTETPTDTATETGTDTATETDAATSTEAETGTETDAPTPTPTAPEPPTDTTPETATETATATASPRRPSTRTSTPRPTAGSPTNTSVAVDSLSPTAPGTTDELGPGFGVASTVAGLLSVVTYLAARRRDESE